MSWISSMMNSIMSWYKKHNSFGDIIRSNKPLFRNIIENFVEDIWDKKDDIENSSIHYASDFISCVTAKFPDILKIVINYAVNEQIESIIKSAFTLKMSKQETVDYIYNEGIQLK